LISQQTMFNCVCLREKLEDGKKWLIFFYSHENKMGEKRKIFAKNKSTYIVANIYNYLNLIC